jgi:hypothetical protein
LNENSENEDEFTPVVSRRKKKKERISACKFVVRGTPTKSGVTSAGPESVLSAAPVKALNDYPLCGILSGTRRRKPNPKYL